MNNKDNHIERLSTDKPVNTPKMGNFPDHFSFAMDKKTFIVLDNATIHRIAKIKQMHPIWEKRELFLFYLPSYSPHLNIAETLWRVIKRKWMRPQDYASATMLFYATNRVLAVIRGE